ncbi:MAG: hypothetical protein K6T99_08345 [Armatimonadetes bacterium]|nr:hypothetical protein [Armatimonadota bacterium]
MKLEYKPDFEEAKKYWRAYWAGEIIDRPLIAIKAPKGDKRPKGLRGLNGLEDFRLATQQYDEAAATIHWLGEAIPFIQPNFGPDQFAAWLGADLQYNPDAGDTSWSVPVIQDWDVDGREIGYPHGVWWERMLEFQRIAAEIGDGKFLVGVPDIHSNMDALSALRGPEALCFDFLDVPEKIDLAITAVCQAFRIAIEGIEKAGRQLERGYIGWLPFYSEERFVVLQCDFACMVGPEHFRRWILPALIEESEYVVNAVYHYDGPGALIHLEDILSIPKIKVIQWTPGAGNPPLIEWMDLLLECQKAGKGLYLAASPDEVKVFHRNLRPEGIMYDVWVSSKEEGEALIDWLKANT